MEIFVDQEAITLLIATIVTVVGFVLQFIAGIGGSLSLEFAPGLSAWWSKVQNKRAVVLVLAFAIPVGLQLGACFWGTPLFGAVCEPRPTDVAGWLQEVARGLTAGLFVLVGTQFGYVTLTERVRSGYAALRNRFDFMPPQIDEAALENLDVLKQFFSDSGPVENTAKAPEEK